MTASIARGSSSSAGRGREQLCRVFRQAQVAVVVLRGQDHVIDDASPSALRALGRKSASDVVGVPFFEAIPELADQGFERVLASVRDTGTPIVRRETPVLLRNLESGQLEERCFDLVFEPLVAEDGSHDDVIAIGIDVTDYVRLRRRADDRAHSILQMNDERLRQVSEAAFVGTWALDLATQTIFADAFARSLFDLPQGGPYAITVFLNQICKPDRERIVDRLERVLQGENGGVMVDEFRTVTSDGEIRWVEGRGKADFDAKGHPLRFVGTLVDVTARKQAEFERERLLASEQRARADAARERRRLYGQFMQAPVAVAVISGRDLVYELANPLYLKMVGKQNVLGRTMREVFSELPAEAQVFAQIARIFEDGEAFRADEYRLDLGRGANGIEEAYFKFTCQPLLDSTGQVAEVMIVSVDVTEQVLARRRSEDLAKELKQADQRKNEFLATLAHELRNPMAAISGALTMLDVTEDDPQRARYLREVAKRQVKNLVLLVDELLDVARITHGKVALHKEVLDLSVVIQRAVAATRVAFEARQQQLTVAVDPRPLHVDADAIRLEQVLVNLLGNAAKFTEPGSRIMLQSSREDDDAGTWGVLRVMDPGCGIPRHMLDSIFDPFTQVSPSIDRSHGGLGLGLALVKHLVELHGGHVSAFSEGLGLGSEFVVRLPMMPPICPVRAKGKEKGGELRRQRILIVEDSDDARDILRQFLEHLGHDVFEASDGGEGMNRFLEVRPEAALVDIGLPGIDGYELARQIRAQPGGDAPFLVALTGYGGPQVKAQAELAGFNAHLTKPFDAAELPLLLQQREQFCR